MHKLVAIGDSLTMGFTSGSIYRADLSYPAMLARALGGRFTYPYFNNDNGTTGGFPLNIEFLLHKLHGKFPNGIPSYAFPRMIMETNKHLADVEEHWEKLFESPGECYHNQAVLSYTMQEAYRLDSVTCCSQTDSPKDNWLLFRQIPEKPMYRAAIRTLCNNGRAVTQLQRVRELSEDGGIENLIISLGANNCLGAIIELSIKVSEEEDLYRQPHERKCNLWLPTHFRQSLEYLASSICELNIKNVFIATVPHVTIPPVSRGTPPKSKRGKYYDYYTRPWIWDTSFLPWLHPYLKREDVSLIDEFIDYYNHSIKTIAKANGWQVIDFCSLLDDIAFRRNEGKIPFKWPDAAVKALQRNPNTSYLVKDGEPTLDTRYLELAMKSPEEKPAIKAGGLFSLDAVHPTTFMYGIIADLFLKAMKNKGVTDADGGIPELDWDFITGSDSLLNNPPLLLRDLRSVLSSLSGKLHGQVFFKVLESFKSNF